MDTSQRAAALKAILDKYDGKTQQLYMQVLDMYRNKGPRTAKTTIRNEMLAMVKEAVE